MDYIENSSNNPHLFSGLVWRLSGGFMGFFCFCFGGFRVGWVFLWGFFAFSLTLNDCGILLKFRTS